MILLCTGLTDEGAGAGGIHARMYVCMYVYIFVYEQALEASMREAAETEPLQAAPLPGEVMLCVPVTYI